jgi:hypothetical protein
MAQISRDEDGKLMVLNRDQLDAETLAAIEADLAQQMESEKRARVATAKAAVAYERLLQMTETRNSGQIARVARFLAATYNGADFPIDIDDLRSFDLEISDDILVCLDAHRFASKSLYSLVPDGEERVRQVIKQWSVRASSSE